MANTLSFFYRDDLASLDLSVPSLCLMDKSETKDSDGKESAEEEKDEQEDIVAVGGCDGILLLTLSENLRELYQAIASAAAEPKPEESEKSSQHILEDFHSCRTIRRLVLDIPTFASILFKKALSGKCRSWAQGHCSRILYAFLETQDDQVREMAKEELQVLVDEGALKITGTKKPE
ncbi:hypothetical protein Bca52824_063645 [Brassica carinata]|uniref:Uncharacterized protein n=1 Tax=Brassica carinata TaxID=52824 RepID=A0A8X7QF48_BRACI|nr:hypothetical protein Bca52824_063645 [Brassica carinata]